MGLAWDDEDGAGRDRGAGAGRGRRDRRSRPCSRTSRTGPDALRVRIDPADARAFVERARRVISAGRPPCPLCGQPLDPSGHVCPRQNGYHRGQHHRASEHQPSPDLTAAARAPGRRGARPARARRTVHRGPARRRVQRHALLRGHRRRRRPPRACTSRSRGSARCGTSPTAPWPSARSPPMRCPPRRAGTSCRRRSTASGPPGPGMVQLWIDTDESVDLVRLIRGRDSDAVRRITVFDAVINNADRKGGHLLPTRAWTRLRRRPRRELPHRGQAAHRAVAVGRAHAARRRAGRAAPAAARARRRARARPLAELLTTPRGAPHARARRPTAVDPAPPRTERRLAGRPVAPDVVASGEPGAGCRAMALMPAPVALREAHQLQHEPVLGRTGVPFLGHPRAAVGRLEGVAPDVAVEVPPRDAASARRTRRRCS